MTATSTPLFLDGIRVIDLTTFLSGPFGTQVLSDMGAEVIKVESKTGDSARHIPPHMVAGDSAYFHAVNRNKASVQIDLKRPEGVAALLELVRNCDVLVENFRPGVLDRLGLGTDVLESVNPSIIVCRISGFGQSGPRRHVPAYDAMIQAWSGGMSLTGHPGSPPARMGLPIGDLAAGLYASLAVLGALVRRGTGRAGAHIDVAMFDSQLALLVYQAAYYLLSDVVPEQQGTGHLSIPTYRSFLCGDGAHVMVTANTEGMWQAMCQVLDLADLGDDPRFATNALRLDHAEELWSVLEPAFAARPCPELVDELLAAGVPAAPVNSIADALHDEQTRARDMVVTLHGRDDASVRVPGNPIKSAGMRPDSDFAFGSALGQDTERVLVEVAELPPAEVARLRQAGVVGPFA